MPSAAPCRWHASLIECAGHVAQGYCAGAADRLHDRQQSRDELIGGRALNTAPELAGLRNIDGIAQGPDARPYSNVECNDFLGPSCTSSRPARGATVPLVVRSISK